MTKMYLVWDGEGGVVGRWEKLEDAMLDAEQSIGIWRDLCDPEWPEAVEDVAVYLDEEDAADPTETGLLVSRAEQVGKHPPDPENNEDTSLDYYCDYKMSAPVAHGQPD